MHAAEDVKSGERRAERRVSTRSPTLVRNGPL
jgi:hypothetical protein